MECRHESERSLARSRRANNEEKILCLLHAQSQFIEFSIVAAELQRGVDSGFALQEEQVAPLLWRRKEGVHSAIEGTIGRFDEVVLDSPMLVGIAEKDVSIRLWGAQNERNAVGCHLLNGTAEYHCAAQVWFLSWRVRIEHHNII